MAADVPLNRAGLVDAGPGVSLKQAHHGPVARLPLQRQDSPAPRAASDDHVRSRFSATPGPPARRGSADGPRISSLPARQA